MSHPFAFKPHGEAEEYAKSLSSSIEGKNVLLVGATIKSLGAEFLRVIVPYAKTIWVAGRNKERLQASVDAAVKGLSKKAEIKIVILDMTSFASVRSAAAIINAEELPIDVIMQNMAVRPNKELTRTVDGLEAQIGGNHFSTFLLVSLLLPRLRQAGPGARVISVASGAAASAQIRWDDVNYKLRPEEYHIMAAYAQSKLANILFTKELAKRLAPEGILAFTLHPGVIMTNGNEALPQDLHKQVGMRLEDGSLNPEFPFKTIPQGVATYVVAAFDPSIKDQSGAFLVDCEIAEAPPSVTEESAAKFWALSEEVVGIKQLSPRA